MTKITLAFATLMALPLPVFAIRGPIEPNPVPRPDTSGTTRPAPIPDDDQPLQKAIYR